MTADCVRSLLGMSSKDFAILVVDNGSHDNSVEYLRRTFPQIEVIANDCNVGFAAGCNIGIRRALHENVEYVLLVNNDTIVDPGLLSALTAEADRDSRVGIASPKIYYFEPSTSIWWVGGTYSVWNGLPKHIDLGRTDTGRYNTSRDLDWATGCVMLLRSEAIHKAGMFDEQIFGNGEDVDLSLRVRQLGYLIRYVPTAKLWHREGVDYRRNVGEYARTFTLIRNLLWLMHKHAETYHWLTFWPYFLGYYLPKMMLLFAIRGDFRSWVAMFHGMGAFFCMLGSPQRSVLPKALQASSRSTKAQSLHDG